jgi:hypothetical protein
MSGSSVGSKPKSMRRCRNLSRLDIWTSLRGLRDGISYVAGVGKAFIDPRNRSRFHSF